MEIKKVINKLECSKEFLEWRKEENNKDSYLVHIFRMVDKSNKDSWQIGYYNKERDRISTFVIDISDTSDISEDKVGLNPETEVFKEPGKSIQKLELSKVKITEAEAIQKADEFVKKEYPTTIHLKKFYIIQTLPESGTVYNTTILTNSFKTINIRINAENNEVVSHQIVDFMSGTPYK